MSMSAWRARAQAENIARQRDWAHEKALSGIPTRVTAKLLKEILLHKGDSGYWRLGDREELRWLVRRSLGCGVYEIHYEAKQEGGK